MKKYFAVVYFASPEIGMVTAGEVLSEEQVKKLGETTVESLVKRGALGEIVEKTAEEKPEKAEEPKEPETVTEDEETGAVLELDEEEAAELEAELPELEISADLVGEPEKAPKSSAKKTGGRRK